MKQISGGPQTIEQKLKRTRDRLRSQKKLAAQGPPSITFQGDHPSEAVTAEMRAAVNQGTKEIYDLWGDLLGDKGKGSKIKDWKTWDKAVEDTKLETDRILRRIRSHLFDYVGEEIDEDQSGIWKLYEDAWRRGYESTGLKAAQKKLTDVDRKWIRDKLTKIQGSLGTFTQETRKSTALYEVWATSEGVNETGGLFRKKEADRKGDFSKAFRSSEVRNRRNNSIRALRTGKWANYTPGGEFIEYIYGQRPIWSARYRGLYHPTIDEIIEEFGLESRDQIRTIPRDELIEFLEDNSKPYERILGIDEYPNMWLKQSATETYNRAFLRGLAQADRDRKVKTMVKVFDGPSCGWTTHDDANKANGLLVTLAEAQRYPLAHPNCIRQFYNPDSPPRGGKKIQQQAQGIVKTKGNQFKRVSTIVGGVSAFSYLVTAALRAGNANLPVVLTAIKRDLATIIPRWRQFEINLDGARIFLGDQFARQNPEVLGLWREVWPNQAPPTGASGLSNDRVRQLIHQNLNNHFENGSPLASWAEQSMGLRRNMTRDVWKEIVYDWADYYEYTEHRMKLSFVELLERHRMVEDATQDFIGHSDEAALKFHMAAPRGVNIGGLSKSGWENALEYLKTGDVERMSEKVVIQLAEAINPFPVIRADFGKFVQFNLRVSIEGRRNLARKLWLRHEGLLLERRLQDIVTSEHDSKIIMLDLEKIKQQFGGQLPVVTKKDIFDALLPRISLFNGRLFSSTLFRENGEVQWAGRFLGKGYLSWLRTESTFRRSTLDRVIRGLREGEISTREAMAMLREEAIHDVEVFRNSPLAANLKFYGQALQSIGGKFIPSKRLGSLKARYNFFGWQGLYDWNELTPEQKVAGIKPIRRREIKITRGLPEKPGNIYPGAQTNIVAFPGNPVHMTAERGLAKTRRFKDPITGEYTEEIVEPQWLTLVRFRMWRGSIIQMARDFRLDIDELAKEWRRIKSHYFNVIENLKPQQLKQLRTWDEVRRYIVNVHMPDPLAHFQKFTGARATIEGIDINEVQGFAADADRVQAYLDRMFPGMPKLRFIVTDAIRGEIQFDADLNAILVHPTMARDWDAGHADLRRRAVRLHWFPQNTDLPIGSMYHEVSHYVVQNMTDREYRNLWRATLAADPRDPKFIKNFDDPGWDHLDTQYMQETVYNTGDEVPTKVRVRNSVARFMGVERDRDGAWRFRVHSSDGHRTYHAPDGTIKTTFWKKGDEIEHTNRHRIQTGISSYAAMSPDELLAEAFTEYMVAMNPRRVAQAVGDYYENLGYRSRPLFGLNEAMVQGFKDVKLNGEWDANYQIIDGMISALERGGPGVDGGMHPEYGMFRVLDHRVVDGADVVRVQGEDGKVYLSARKTNKNLGIMASDIPDVDQVGETSLLEKMNSILDDATRELPFVTETGLKVLVTKDLAGQRYWLGMWDPNSSILALDYDYAFLAKSDPISEKRRAMYADILGPGIEPKFSWGAGNTDMLFRHELTHAKHTLALRIAGGLGKDRQEVFLDTIVDALVRNKLAFSDEAIITPENWLQAIGPDLVRIQNTGTEEQAVIARKLIKEFSDASRDSRGVESKIVNQAILDLQANGAIEYPVVYEQGFLTRSDAIDVLNEGYGMAMFFKFMARPIDAVQAARVSGSVYGNENIMELFAESVVGFRSGHQPAADLGQTIENLFNTFIVEGYQHSRDMRSVMAAHMGTLLPTGGITSLDDLVRTKYPQMYMRLPEYEGYLTGRLGRIWDNYGSQVQEFNEQSAGISPTHRVLESFDFEPNNGGRFTVTILNDKAEDVPPVVSMLWEQGRSIGLARHLDMEYILQYAREEGLSDLDDVEDFLNSPDLQQTIIKLADTVEIIMETVIDNTPTPLREVGDVFRVGFVLGPEENSVAFWNTNEGFVTFNLSEVSKHSETIDEIIGNFRHPKYFRDKYSDIKEQIQNSGLDLEIYKVLATTSDGLSGQAAIRNIVVHEMGHAQETLFWHTVGLLDRDRSTRVLEKLLDHLANHKIALLPEEFGEETPGASMNYVRSFARALRQSSGIEDDIVGQEIVKSLSEETDMEELKGLLSDALIHFNRKGVLPSTILDKSWALDAGWLASVVDTNPDEAYRKMLSQLTDLTNAYEVGGTHYSVTNFHELVAEALAFKANPNLEAPPLVDSFATGLQEIYNEAFKEFTDQHGMAAYIWFTRKLGRLN